MNRSNSDNSHPPYHRMQSNTSFSMLTGKSRTPYEGYCKAVDGYGIVLETDRRLAIGARINIRIPSEYPKSELLDAQIEVVRIKALINQQKFEVGAVVTSARLH